MSATRMVKNAEPRPIYRETAEVTGIEPAELGREIEAEIREAWVEFKRIMSSAGQ